MSQQQPDSDVRQDAETPAAPDSVPCKKCGSPVSLRRRGPNDVKRILRAVRHTGESPLLCPACIRAVSEEQERAARDQLRRDRDDQLARTRADLPGALAAIGVPAQYRAAALDRCPDLPRDLVAAVAAWAESPRDFWFLSGPAGSGKTWLAVAALARALSGGLYGLQDVRFIGEGDFLQRLRRGFDEGYTEPPWRCLPRTHPRRVALLALDDLASSRLTDWGRAEVARLIVDRHAHAIATIITSNVAPSEIAEKIDSRSASRIAEAGNMARMPRRDLRVCGSLKGKR